MNNLKPNWSASSVAVALLLFFVEVHAEQYPFDSDNWEITGEEFEIIEYRGKTALRLRGGNAILKSVELQDGVVEFDIAVSELRGFAGGRFRAQDLTNFEHFYIRPHQSGNPDANQYTPVFDGVSSWQLYYGEGYASPVEYIFNEWMHIKIVFQGARAEIYVNSDEPNLLVSDLKRAVANGTVGLDASALAEAYFANYEVSPLPDDYQFDESEVSAEMAPETVSSWQVSDVFDRAQISDMDTLTAEFRAERQWTRLQAEATGITNLARIQGVAAEKNTAIARLLIESDREQIKGLNFGYSDDVSVYVNGARLYGGSNFYTSRDYRYLGTIGLFDKVYLPLEVGENEVWFAVTEAFGGWGIQAQFDDLEGISVLTDP